MKFRRHAIELALGLCLSVLSGVALAGLDEGLAAYGKGDYATAMREFRPLAEQGNALAQFSLGVMYDFGLDVAQDYQEALNWYRLAAAQGDANAQNNLGVMYKDGQGVAQDYQEAAKWFRLATEQGNAAAQNNLGETYKDGQGVTQDYQKAAKWFRLAATQGDADAQFNLGVMYQYGQGVPSSPVAAYALYNLAAANDIGSPDEASANQTRLVQTLSAKEIAAGQALELELSKPGNLLNALDQYVKTTVSKSAK